MTVGLEYPRSPIIPRNDGEPFPRAATSLCLAVCFGAAAWIAVSAAAPAAEASSECTLGALTMALSQAAGPGSAGSVDAPSDVLIESGYPFVMLASVGFRLWPDNIARLDGLARAGDRADAACKVKTPHGSSWLAVRSANGILRYVPITATERMQAYDASLLRLHKIWRER